MYDTKRKAFAMIMAIFVVLLVAAGGALLLSNASLGSKTVGDNYLRAQAELLAQSATEYAVMQVQGFDPAANGNNCLNNILIAVNDPSGSTMFDVNVTILYSFKGTHPGGACDFIDENTSQDTRLLVDTMVTTHTAANLSTEEIRVHKRSWQSF